MIPLPLLPGRVGIAGPLVPGLFLLASLLFGPRVVADSRPVPEARQTALDRYVAKPDPSYSWKMAISLRDESATGYAIDMTSQTWRTSEEVDQTAWRHWLLVVKPDNLAHTTGLLFISGGSNKGNNRPPTPSAELIRIAKATRCVVAELKMVPNQPLVFNKDGSPRVEDDLIAYTWDKFLRTGDETWPARLPMTKAAVRAMDTITEFLGSEAGGKAKVDTYVVSGGSKRGWTTWTTAAVDRRVVAICPIVIDVLNMAQSIKHHYRAYGFYAPAVGNYAEQHRILDWQDTPEIVALDKIEDPFSYRDRMTMPKLILNAAGDQFFLPDSSQFYFTELPDPKYLRYVANTDHSMRNSDAYETLLAWQYAIANKVPLPRFTWVHGSHGTLTLRAETKPTEVVLWTGHNDAVRDFRLEVAGPIYKSVPVSETSPGVYVANIPEPKSGWTAYFAELSFDVGAATPLKLTTDVTVTPRRLPFPDPKPASTPKGFLSR
ncbi:MAG: PhoPQ-activated pathogenicity [Verrucomicrobia bacterium]|nr:PhoPQ-activated pathogenicity [Verrucomicrobiota bacterium]